MLEYLQAWIQGMTCFNEAQENLKFEIKIEGTKR